MKKTIFFLALLVISVSAKAQITLPSINSMGKLLSAVLDDHNKSLLAVADTLQNKGYTLLGKNVDDNGFAYYRFGSATDTVRKEMIDLAGAQITNGSNNGKVEYAVRVSTLDISQYNGWLNKIRSNPDFLFDQKNSTLNERIYNATPYIKEIEFYRFSTATEKQKNGKLIFRYTVVFIRRA